MKTKTQPKHGKPPASRAARPPVSATVEMRGGRPSLIINGETVPPLIYALPDAPGARWTWEEVPARNIALFAERGIRLFQFDVNFEHMIGPDDRLDITLARKQIAGVLAAGGARALVMPRLHINAPPWWCERNPGECVGYADGTPPNPEKRWGLERLIGRDLVAPLRASFYSEKWRAWARGHIAEFCARLAATPEGASVFAMQIANGVYGEWHQFSFFNNDPDNGPAAAAAFRRWLRARYKTSAALASAWSREKLTLAAAAIPGRASRAIADLGIVRDPVLRRPVIDYYTFLHEGMADTLLMMAGEVKRNWPRPVVTAAFNGYFYGMFGRHAEGGHLALARLLASPALDCVCATPSYEDTTRNFGATGHGRVFSSAILRAGKLWLEELDAATSVGGCPWDKKFTSTIPDDIAMFRRDLLQAAVQGGGSWLFDFGMLGTQSDFQLQGVKGWWDDPTLQDALEKLFALIRARARKPFTRAADVLVIHDPWAFASTISRSEVTAPAGEKYSDALLSPIPPRTLADPLTPLALDGLMEGLAHSGLVADDALLSELPAIDLAPRRLVIFATAPVLDAGQRKFIREKVARDGRHVVFIGYCGWSDGKTLSAQNAMTPPGAAARARRLENPASELLLDGVAETLALKQPLELPAFETQPAGGVETVGRWKGDGAASAICARTDDATLWAFALPPNSPDFLRALGRRAGCRVLNDANDANFLGGGLLAVHTIPGGPRALRLPNGRVIKTSLPPRSTVVFDAETGEILLG